MVSQLVSEVVKINLIIKSYDFPISALVDWILSICLNIHTLRLPMSYRKPNTFHNGIARLNKLKELEVTGKSASELKEVTLIAFRITITLLISS